MPKYEAIFLPESLQLKFPILSPQAMRNVLAYLEESDDDENSPNEKKQFKGLMSDIPDIEGECSVY